MIKKTFHRFKTRLVAGVFDKSALKECWHPEYMANFHQIISNCQNCASKEAKLTRSKSIPESTYSIVLTEAPRIVRHYFWESSCFQDTSKNGNAFGITLFTISAPWNHDFFQKALKVEMIWGKGRNIINYDQPVTVSRRVGHWKKGHMLRQSLKSMLFFKKC